MARKIIRPLAPGVGAPRLASLGPRPQRVALYVRVSSEEQLDGYSLDAQRRAARAFCAERGWEIVAEYAEEGRSARYEDLSRRPRFKAMLEAADRRLVDVVLVHKLDRFARNLLVLLASLNRLGRADVSFVSTTEQIDYSTPQGRLFLVMLGALAEWYSNNLSQETKKGKRERKAQGLYNGLLPFGMVAGPDGLPTADTRPFCVLTWVERDDRRVVDSGRETCNAEGLRLAVRLARDGASDSAVAQALNAAGYRTTGNRGQNPFHKDTVAELLTNRFYWGELPVYEEVKGGDGLVRKIQVGRTPGRHAALDGFDEELWERIQATRERNRTRATKTNAVARTYALTGLVTCHGCEGPVGVWAGRSDRPRLVCRHRTTAVKHCSNRFTYQDVYEDQIGDHLASFRIPADAQERLLALARGLAPDADEQERTRQQLESRLERIKKLYEWGDKPEADYLSERADIQRQLAALRPPREDVREFQALAAVLRDVAAGWQAADQERRNRLARTLFEDVRVLGDAVVGLKPRATFAPFFLLNLEEWRKEQHPGDPAGVSTACSGSGSDGIRTRMKSLTRRCRPTTSAPCHPPRPPRPIRCYVEPARCARRRRSSACRTRRCASARRPAACGRIGRRSTPNGMGASGR